ncbi:MAG: hypothetical protein EBQ92_11000 [Proteobacteria bacterium]|nr:hypothetical protein [Pseudomonadota bacterium]
MNKHLSSIKKTAVLVAVGWLAVPAFAGIGGFIDAQVGSKLSGTPEQSLNSEIADGAVYLSKELGRGKMMVDLPFSFSAANADVNTFGGAGIPGAALVAAGYDSAFRAFNTKAQAYINWSYDFGLSWQLGRFDSPFLNEANDTVGLNAYTTQGHLFSLLPRMHNGLMLTYGTGSVTLMGIASRQDGTVGARATGAAAENLEYGIMGKWTRDAMYVGAGAYLHKPDATSTGTHQIIEVMAGTKMSDWTVDAQALFTKVATSGAESGFGIGGTINYAVDKTWSVGVRPNYSSKVSAASSHAAATTGSTLEIAVGPQVNLTDDLRMRANYTYTSVKQTSGATADNTSEWALSAVYKF